jgi:2-desacetyl-2-hydroxyethyl bacteriochlorophyllide A dehydrogenase
MREVVITGPRRVELRTVPDERLMPTGIRIRSLYSGISHGTEMSFYRAAAPQISHDIDDGLFQRHEGEDNPYPIAHGYEMVGEVMEVGSDVRGFTVGDIAWTGTSGHPDTFVCDTTETGRPFFCERAPDGANPAAGVFLALGGVAYDAHLTSHLRLGESVVISGLGAVGLLSVQLARVAGISPIIAVDPVAARREMAISLGANHVIDPAVGHVAEQVRDLNGGKGVDAAIEASGSWSALHEAVRCCASGFGRVVAVGFYQGEGTDLRLGEEFHHSTFHSMGASTILAIDHRKVPAPGRAWDRIRVYRTIAGMLADGTLGIRDLLTHTVPQSDAHTAFELVDQHSEGVIKVALTYE